MARPRQLPEDKLPPHSMEAERGVLGCLLLGPALLAHVREKFGAAQPWYDLRHEKLFVTLCNLADEGKAIDIIILTDRLRTSGNLEAVGGLAYVAGLPDSVPSAANLDYYLELVWEKYIARRGIQEWQALAERTMAAGDLPASVIAQQRQRWDELEAAARERNEKPDFLSRPNEFLNGVWARFQARQDGEEPGFKLPIAFKHNIRYEECTLVAAEEGAGKSTWMRYMLLHLAAQLNPGETVCIAAFEEPVDVTLWVLASQLLGKKYLPESRAGLSECTKALAWLQRRFVLYNFQGIGDYRDVLSFFGWCARNENSRIFKIDNAMRIGIADDDYGTQGIAAAAMADFAMKSKGHLFCVIHENKGDGKGKSKIRGSALWRANFRNIWQIERNEKKGEEIAKIENRIKSEKRSQKPDEREIRADEEKLALAKQEWDTAIYLRKQSYPGARQNASRYVCFDPENFQFRVHWNDPPVNWLRRWTGRREDAAQTTQIPNDPSTQEAREEDLTADGADNADTND